ncbi:hypothetical protein [Coralloluteibacterium stylophorae]|uniref:Uncharacterized protein n=1 Tax=Coralloluteibacterium stylophorae TaxID=1776034 RepID=A0A8J7VSW3_9GAMM|nr:hypothetical protein [Coralloluteibacterium stylophorae]MBS7457172.1 hypothetical protein [Coralloluteibacterium stylophorae]
MLEAPAAAVKLPVEASTRPAGHQAKLQQPALTLPPRSRAGMPLEGDPFGPRSAAEQAWLDRAGYPNAEQWAAYEHGSDYLLEAAAAKGDTAAATMLALRNLRNGDPDAKERLLELGADGSLFALEMLSSHIAGPMQGNLSEAYAVSRVAEMKGNFVLSLARDYTMPRQLTQQERVAGEEAAIRLLNKLNEIALLKTGRVPPVDPRPIIISDE